ncbi:MAG TPA: sugar phosphate isomerase/epimerase family protein [Tepidisphaeraceae bacterium]|nr:sugar phosphate isomerase/epimerase family protein [Tepidisphaeraceae bacterium]
MLIRHHPLGVCSWSLGTPDVNELIRTLRELGLAHAHLAVGPLLEATDAEKHAVGDALARADVTITATMIGFPGEDYSTIASIRDTGGFGPDDRWPERLSLTVAAADVTRDLGGMRLSTHIGFVPHDRASPRYATFVDRCRHAADAVAGRGLSLVLETGQEPAATLAQFLADVDRPNLLVNFDPANMILYGSGDPVAAVRTLGPHLGHVHVKDATPSGAPGVDWGDEVVVGTGAVDWRAFLDALDEVGYEGPLAIEREAGPTRMADVGAAIAALRSVESRA